MKSRFRRVFSDVNYGQIVHIFNSKGGMAIDYIRKTRQLYGISQNQLAVASGITREYLSKIELGQRKPAVELVKKIEARLEGFNPDHALEMLFDYVRIRFPTNDVKHIITQVLRMKPEYFLYEDYGFYGYDAHGYFGNIIVMASMDEERGILLELKGQGCRQFESILLAQGRSWYKFFRDCLKEKCIFKRIDLAINDKADMLDIPSLARKCKNEECISVFRSFRNYRSGELTRRDEKENMGNTLYIGSPKSEVYFCIYEKDYEQYVKSGIELEDADVKNRFEIRLKNDRALHAINDLLAFEDVEKTTFAIINRYIRFVDRDAEKRRSQWETNEEWQWFIGNNRSQLRLTTKPEPYSYERTLRWLHHQVAPTLKVACEMDIFDGTTIVGDMLEKTALQEKHLKLLRQLQTPVKEVVL